MRKIFCDKCGTEVKKGGAFFSLRKHSETGKQISLDLCEEDQVKFISFLNLSEDIKNELFGIKYT